MTRPPALAAVLVLTGVGAAALPPLAAAAGDARLQGRWTMAGRVTHAIGVRGEHAGQRVTRAWSFTSACAIGPCRSVSLRRERTAHQFDSLRLRRVSPGTLTGRGRFYVRLRCAGRTYRHGGIAYYRVRVTIRSARVVQGTPFAIAIHATYTNSKRVNRTPCPGSLGRDAGSYSGRLSSPVPVAPVADFTSSVDAAAATASFTDRSSSPTGAKVVGWRWDFGDPASASGNVSTDPNPSHHYTAGGPHTVSLTVTDSNGLTATVTRQVVV